MAYLPSLHWEGYKMLKLITLNAGIYTLLSYEANAYNMDILTVIFVGITMCFVIPMVLMED